MATSPGNGLCQCRLPPAEMRQKPGPEKVYVCVLELENQWTHPLNSRKPQKHCEKEAETKREKNTENHWSQTIESSFWVGVCLTSVCKSNNDQNMSFPSMDSERVLASSVTLLSIFIFYSPFPLSPQLYIYVSFFRISLFSV